MRGGIGAEEVGIGVGGGGSVAAGAGAGEGAQRRWAQALASVRRYPPVAQQADSRLQLPGVSKAPLDGAT